MWKCCFFYWCNDSSRTTKQRVKSLVFQKCQALPAHFVDLGTLLDRSIRRSPGAWWNGGCVMVCKKRKDWTVPVPVLVLQKTCFVFFGDVYWKAFLNKKSDAIIYVIKEFLARGNKNIESCLGMMCGNNMLLIDLALQHIPIIFPDVFLFQWKKWCLDYHEQFFIYQTVRCIYGSIDLYHLHFFLPKLCVLRL